MPNVRSGICLRPTWRGAPHTLVPAVVWEWFLLRFCPVRNFLSSAIPVRYQCETQCVTQCETHFCLFSNVKRISIIRFEKGRYLRFRKTEAQSALSILNQM